MTRNTAFSHDTSYIMPWAERRAHGDVNKAVRMVTGDYIAPRRVRQDTGYSLAQILERLSGESIAENARQAGVCPATVRKYRERWGI